MVEKIDMDMIRAEDLVKNAGQRVPVCLCLDTSGSMLTMKGGAGTGEFVTLDGRTYELGSGGISRLSTLQTGIKQFYDAVYQDTRARYAVELAIVTFNDAAEVLSKFSRVEYKINGVKTRQEPPSLEAHGYTHLGEGLNLALDILDERKKEYQKRGVDYYQPWLVVMTDGQDNGSREELTRARQRVQQLVGDRKLTIYPFFIGGEDNSETAEGMETLASISPKQKPILIETQQMAGLFEWLGKSVVAMSSGDLDGQEPPNLNEFVVKSWDAPFAGGK